MDSNEMMTRGHWMTMEPFGNFISILVFIFLLLGIAAFIKYLFFNRNG